MLAVVVNPTRVDQNGIRIEELFAHVNLLLKPKNEFGFRRITQIDQIFRQFNLEIFFPQKFDCYLLE